MSVCAGIGNGIGGAIGKWSAGLGSALGLGTVVDLGVRAYTGYGLLETLSVPYIECPDGTFASAIEWYGSGLKCPKRPDPKTPITFIESSQRKAAKGYNDAIKKMGGVTYTYWGAHEWGNFTGQTSTTERNYDSGHWQPTTTQTDNYGNTLSAGYLSDGRGDSQVFSLFISGIFLAGNYGWGGWGSSSYPAGVSTDSAFSPQFIHYLEDRQWQPHIGSQNIIGIRAFVPSGAPKAPPAARIPRPRGFEPTKPPKREDCEEVACPCITPADIQKAVRQALGLKPFAPEKLIREMGAKMYAAPGPSVVPVAPLNLVEAIAAIQAASYMRAGYGRYPVLMPDSIVADDNPTDIIPAVPIENYAEWFEWWIKQFDAIMGQFPIKIAIVDGAKRQPLKFENVSEALAEMAGLQIQTATDADAAVAVSSHAAVAATKAQTAAIIAQKNAECLIKFFGIRTGFGSIFVQSAITPQDSDSPTFNLKKFLTPSQQAVAFYTDNDPFDFQAVLDRILRNSEIAKSAVAMDAKTGLVGDYARNQRKYDAAEAKKEAEKELDKLQAAINANNPEFKVKIRVDTAAPSGDLLGNNFVIKRPKIADE